MTPLLNAFAQARLLISSNHRNANYQQQEIRHAYVIISADSNSTSSWSMRNDSVWISRSDSVWISWNDSVLIDLFIPADGYSDFNQQVHYMLLTSRCISKIAKRRHLNKLERHRLSLKKSADGKTHMHISR
ncbi:histone-lysine N-methyltransferase, H3 lysine-9 specific SUVH1-like [Dorcoceras hygrometricum]|uniref:Histone-lysine N-methyltransferase, H3 lysine-9 specific SUVH1-like n=1 Tax=Dorcoceras hygrometricum TaxID=472368 RepID=A0A2Z7C9T2_9LAMI|nr:histone-lysine N-methyltransferase, H3 lysine-9 specific SUVH1-like [Dorcoceras hygrometricum]